MSATLATYAVRDHTILLVHATTDEGPVRCMPIAESVLATTRFCGLISLTTFKVSCSRHQDGCTRCKAQAISCVYTRSGIIRRNRKRRETLPLRSERPLGGPGPGGKESIPRQRPGIDSTHTTHERMRMLAGSQKDHESLTNLALLFEAYQTVWQDSSGLDFLAEGVRSEYAPLEKQESARCVQNLLDSLQRTRLPLKAPPEDTLVALRSSRSQDVRERAWLVMFYTIALSGSLGGDLTSKNQMRTNFWLAFNDARFLLEPTVATIQALLLVVKYLDDVLSLSMCGILINKACSMLEAVGIVHHRRGSTDQEQRVLLFWELNALDKALSLALCRPPIFHDDHSLFHEMPKLDRLMPSSTNEPYPRLFEAHFTFHLFRLSQVMADVRSCVHGGRDVDIETYTAAREAVENWFKKANEVISPLLADSAPQD